MNVLVVICRQGVHRFATCMFNCMLIKFSANLLLNNFLTIARMQIHVCLLYANL